MLNANTCPKCGTANAAENIFCQACGNRLANTAPAAQVSFPASQQTLQTHHYGTIPIDSLGTRLDGWADVIPNAANKAADVKAYFETELNNCGFPQTNIIRADLTPGGLTGQRRPYVLIQSYTGATIAVYISEFGKSLYMAWELFVRPVIKWQTVGIMAGAAFILALLPQLGGNFSFFGLLFGTAGWLITICIGAAIAGKVMRNSIWAFFIQEINLFGADDVTAAMLATHKSLLTALDRAGVESTQLRDKINFKAGRQERLI
jgi:Uncharacterized protein conserved in bacteria